jgi:hypothetical protein
MSRYHLTEAYGELYNSRFTEASFYDNLRFVDYLQQEEIEEVMESLIWEFMDYGDTLDEAVDTLEYIFTDDEIIFESLELINEATVTYGRGDIAGASRRHQEASNKRREERVQQRYQRYKTHTDEARRARRAARFSAVAKPLKDAAGTVSDAVKGARKSISNRKTQLKKAGSETVEKAQAALAKVGRGGRRIVNAVKGAYKGAKSGYEAPLPQPTARTANGDVFATPKAAPNRLQSPRASQSYNTPSRPSPGAAQAAALRKKTSVQGRTVAPTQKPPSLGLKSLSDTPASRTNPISFSKKTRERMGVRITSTAGRPLKNPEKIGQRVASARRVSKANESVDYDLLTQYMIEDLINEGYADTERQAVSILENMTTETLTEFASIYLND